MIGKLRHINDPRKAASELMTRFRLIEAADRHVGKYYGGMRRRLDISMSLIGSHKVVFLDEPTTGLNPEARIEVWKGLNSFQKKK